MLKQAPPPFIEFIELKVHLYIFFKNDSFLKIKT